MSNQISNNTLSNKRIFKNTIYLYFRMLFTMVVSLYTSRVVLDVLGVSDYGIYNVIGGLVVLISILNNSMSAATQRFITFELGKGDLKQVSDTFSMSMTIHILVCVFILIIGETAGLYYVTHYLNVPPDRADAAFWVFQLSLATLVFNIIRVPYNASIIAYEKMSFFAMVSIVETLLHLGIVFVLPLGNFDKLIFYGFLILFVSAIITFSYKYYCNKTFETCRYYLFIDKGYFKKLLNFVGWNFVGAIATTGTHQVGNMMVNFFCGPTVNAAYGVANRVNNAIAGFTNNFQVAFTPQITKLYSQNEKEKLFTLMNRSALLSYYLLFIIAIPLCFNLDVVLSFWLVEVPAYSSIFIIFLIIYNLIDSLQAPFWKVIAATGNIKYYEIWLNVLLMLNIPASYLMLKNGYAPYVVVIISASLNLVSAIIRTIHVKIQIGVSIRSYFKFVIVRSFAVSIVYILPMIFINQYLAINNIFIFSVFYILSLLYNALMIYLIGLGHNEKIYISKIVKSKICR